MDDTPKGFKTTFRDNGYRLKQTSLVHNPTVRTSKPKEKPNSVAILSFMQKTYGRLKKMLGTDISLPLRKICSFIRPVKDDKGLRTVSAYSFPCECGQVYIGRLINPLRPDLMSTTGTYGLDRQTNRRWRNIVSTTITSLNSKTPKFSLPNPAAWTDFSERRLIWSSSQNNMNREDGLALGRSWKPLIRLFREIRQSSHCGA